MPLSLFCPSIAPALHPLTLIPPDVQPVVHREVAVPVVEKVEEHIHEKVVAPTIQEKVVLPTAHVAAGAPLPTEHKKHHLH